MQFEDLTNEMTLTGNAAASSLVKERSSPARNSTS